MNNNIADGLARLQRGNTNVQVAAKPKENQPTYGELLSQLAADRPGGMGLARGSIESSAGLYSETETVNWTAVLASLQREKRLANARKEEHYINRSLFMFESSSKAREWAIKLVEWPLFDKIILFLIAFNCILLTFDDPVCRCSSSVCTAWELYQQSFYNHDCTAWATTLVVLQYSEIMFTIIFAMEMFLKIFARGFVLHKHAYLRDPWNWLDFIVVLASLLSFTPGVNISILRTFRVLRPLRTLSRIKSMKPLLTTFAKSLASIANVFALLAFFMVIYSILAIELMSGSLRGYCYFDPRPGRNNFAPAALARLLAQQVPFMAEQWNILGAWNVYVQTCRPEGETAFGEASGFRCPPLALDGVLYNTTCSTRRWCGGDWCADSWNPNPLDDGAGYISYDNMFSALVTTFQCLTFASWNDIQYRISNGGNVWLSRIYHTSWIFIGAFVVVQLALAVLAEAFVLAQEEQRTEREREALHDESVLRIQGREADDGGGGGPFGMGGPGGRGGRGVGRRFSMTTFAIPKKYSVFLSREAAATSHSLQRLRSRVGLGGLTAPDWAVRGWGAVRDGARVVCNNAWFQRLMTVIILVNTACLGIDYHDQDLFEASLCRARCGADPWLPAAAADRCTGPLFNRSFSDDGTGVGYRPPQAVFCFLDNDAGLNFTAGGPYTASNCSAQTTAAACAQDPRCGWIGGQCRRGVYNITNFAKSAIRTATNPPVVGRITLRDLCGSENEHGTKCPNYPVNLSVGLEAANYVFTGIFVVELILKLLAMGIYSTKDGTTTGYFAESFNWVDFAIVVASTVDAISSLAIGTNGGALTSLRALRILRMLRLVRSWKGLQRVLRTLIFSLTSLGPLCIMIALFMYIFALLGMQLFGAMWRYNKTDVPRSNFDSFFPSETGHGAFLAVFQIITTENWNNMMYCAMLGFQSTPWAALFFIFVMLIGNYMFMNLFISILLQGIGQDQMDEEDAADAAADAAAAGPGALGSTGAHTMRRKSVVSVAGRRSQVGNALKAALTFLDGSRHATQNSTIFPAGLRRTISSGSSGPPPTLPGTGSAGPRRLADPVTVQRASDDSGEGGGGGADDDDQAVTHSVRLCGITWTVRLPNHQAFFLFGPRNPLRVAAAMVVRSQVMENLILVLILASSISLMVEAPTDLIVSSDSNCPPPPGFLDCSGAAAVPGQVVQLNCPRTAGPGFGQVFAPCDSPDKGSIPGCCAIKAKMHVLNILNEVFTLIFFVEMVLKILADGLALHPLAYLRDGWNWLDLAIVVISLLSTFSNSSGGTFKALRTLRALRPLRVIKRNPGLKVAVNALLSSLPEMGNVSLVVLFWLCMYAMLGVQIFKGRFWKCYDYDTQFFPGAPLFPLSNNLFSPTNKLAGPGAVPSILECVSALDAAGTTVWTNRPFSFDMFFRAMLTLFEMMTTSGWMEVLQSAVDSVLPGVTPAPNANPWYAMYGVAHLFVGNFVLINLVVGTVLSTYIRMKQQNDGINPFMTPEQQQWREIQNLMALMKPRQRAPENSSPLRRAVFRFVESRGFDLAVRGVIVVTVVSQMLKTHDQSPGLTVALFWVNMAFTLFYFFEAGCKLLAFGWRFYMSAGLNQFDLFVCGLSVVRLALDVGERDYDARAVATRQDSASGMLQSFFHALCVVRAFRLLRFTKGLREMIRTIVHSIPALGNLGALVLLILVIFSILGFNLFYNVNLVQDPYQRMGAYGTPYASYTSLDNTLWLIFRMTTGDFWNGMMYYSAGMYMDDEYERCAQTWGDYLGNGCGDMTTSLLFHIVWIVFGEYVLMQLFSAVILENFAELARGNRAAVPLDVLDEFVNAWAFLDPHAKGSIHLEDLPLLLLNIRPPLGVRNKHTRSMALGEVNDVEAVQRRRNAARTAAVLQVIKDLSIPIRRGNMITYRDTFVACAKRVLMDAEEKEESEDAEDRPETPASADGAGAGGGADPAAGMGSCDGAKVVDHLGRPYTAADEFAARSVQVAYREYREIRIQVRKCIHMTLDIPLEGSGGPIIDY